MINNKTKRGLLVALGLIITSCSTSINSIQEIKSSNSINSDSKTTNEMRVSDKNVTTFLTNEEFESLKKEYSGFKTLALSYEYLYRKVQKLLTYTDDGLYLTREIEFARVIHPSLLLQIYCDHPELYSASIIKPKVIERKTNDSIFNDYLVQLSCGSNSGGGGSSGNDEFQVNTSTLYGRSNPSVAMNSSGNYVVVWQSDVMQYGDSKAVYAQIFNPDGTKNGSEIQVNEFTTSYHVNPDVAMDNAGNFVVTWQSRVNNITDEVLAKRYNSDGIAQGSEFQVNTYTSNFQGYPSIGMDSIGNFAIVWQSYDGGGAGISAQRFDNNGNTIGNEFTVNSYTTDTQDFPDISMNSLGNFVITWESAIESDSSFGIYAKRYDSNGSSLGSEFHVNTYINSMQRYPKISANDSGNFVITWQSFNQNGNDDWDVFAQRFNSDGIMQGSEFQANSYTLSPQARPSVAINNSGNFVITWQEENLPRILAQKFNSNGIMQGNEIQISSSNDGDKFKPNLSMNNNGNYVVVWYKSDTINNIYNIYEKKLIY